MYKGGCLCGAVRFFITGPICNIVYCHCSQCRRAQGTAFATNGIVDADDFELTKGAHNLTTYTTQSGSQKVFCRTCGSPIVSKRASAPDVVRVRVGTIESDISERPIGHIFATSKAIWEDIADELPQYPGYEPGR